MAIKKKDESKSLPARLCEILKAAFTLQVIKDFYEAEYKARSKDIKAYFDKNEDGFDVSYGKGAGFTCEQGSVSISLGKTYNTDVDKIIDLVDTGKITLTSLLGAVTFRQTDLQTVLGSHYAKCVEATDKDEVTITLKGSKEFKERVQSTLGDLSTSDSSKLDIAKSLLGEDDPVEAVKKIEPFKVKSKSEAKRLDVLKEEVKTNKAIDSLAKAKAAAAKAKSKVKSADQDLDDILNEES